MNKPLKLLGIALPSIYFIYYIFTLTEWHFIDSINLIFHEAGHMIVFFLGNVMQALAGSLFQILIPLIVTIYFFKQKQKISSAICLMWAGQNFLNVSMYAKDAIVMQLPLLGGDSVHHDWNFILSNLNLLQSAPTIGNILYGIGVILICLGIIFALKYVFVPTQEIVK